MAKQEKRTRPGGEPGSANIEGVPRQERPGSTSSRREECDSALDGPECIEGVEEKRRKQERHTQESQDQLRK